MFKLLNFIILIFLISACKPEVPDKENYFYLKFNFADSTRTVKNVFSKIYGKSEGRTIPSTRTSDSTANLPLDFNSDNVTFYFVSEGKTDSIYLEYHFNIRKNNEEYYAEIEKLKAKTSFKNLKLNCEGNKKECNDANSGDISL